MFLNIASHKFVTLVKALCITALCAGLMIFSKHCFNGAVNGIEFCLKILIPSLFPFMALSSFIVKSGISHSLGKIFNKPMKKLFGLSGCFAPVIILSMIGGYPIGARGISSLYKSNAVSQKEAEKAALFSVCAGPGFIVNFVGVSLYGSKTIGFIILISQVLSVIIIGIALNLADRSKAESYNSNNELKSSEIPISSAIVEAAADSSAGIINICAFVVIFSALSEIICSLVSSSALENTALCLLEVCTAVNRISKEYPLEFVAFAIGFGGLCVHFQIFSALGNIKINKLTFFCIRIIQGIITALLTHLGSILFLNEQQVFSTASAESAEIFGGTVISGAALIGVAICFLFSLKTYKHR